MNIKSTLFFLLHAFFFSTTLQAQRTGDYRSNVATTGVWSDASSWERFDGTSWVAAAAAPSSSDGIITIQDGDSIQLTSATTIDQVRVASGGILSIFDIANPFPKTVFTLDDVANEEDLQVEGRLYLSVGALLTGTGTVSINSGGLLFIRRQGVLAVNTTIQASGALHINEIATVQSTLTNNGTINWFRNNLNLVNGTLINNATLNVLTTGNSVVTNDAGTNFFHNTATGVITRANPGGTFYINVPFRNDGRIKGAGALEINNAYSNSGTYAPGAETGRFAINSRAFTPAAMKIDFNIADSFAVTGGNDTLHISASNVLDLSNTAITITGSAYAPVGTVYTIMTTSGTFSGTFQSAVFSEYYGELTITPKAVTIKKIKAGPTVVVWGTITAVAVNSQVLVSWTTLQEVNTTNFIVEHSLNGTDFAAIGSVAAAGLSTVTSSYSFTHANPRQGTINYYRIRHVNENGIISYSPIASVRLNANGAAAVIGPNPVRDILHFNIQSTDISIHVTNMAGQTVNTWQLAQGMHPINISYLPAGIYHFAVYQKEKQLSVQRILKL
jgi:hypothetical protein